MADKAPEKMDLAEIRDRINAVDERIQDLINDRAKIAQLVGVAKGELLSLIHISEPTRQYCQSRMPSSA